MKRNKSIVPKAVAVAAVVSTVAIINSTSANVYAENEEKNIKTFEQQSIYSMLEGIEPVEVVEEEPVEEDVIEGHEINLNEWYRLAQLMYAENGNAEYDEAVLLTGVVALKRMKSDSYPDTLEGVIEQKGQYQCYINGSIECEPDDRCLEIAEEILRYDLADEYPDNLVYQAEFTQGSEVYRHLGNQYFCLE